MKKVPPSFNRVVVDLDALKHNYTLLKKKAGTSAFLAMVKADAYGHGMAECSYTLEENGCSIFGVAELREAVILRQSGITSTIFAMIGFDRDDAECFVKYDIIPVVYDFSSLQALSSAAVLHKKEISIHVKVDCGMHRLGIMPEDLPAFIRLVQGLPGVKFGGIASHFPSSDDVNSSNTEECFARFEDCKKLLGESSPPIHHIANSGATLNFKKTHCDMVRCGIALYGYYPDGKRGDTKEGLRPVMSFTTHVLQVKDVPSGAGISYGHTFITTRPTRLAVLPVGYEDGFSRQLSNCGEVLIRGKRAPVRGRVCMNLCMVDITDIDGVTAGDEVVLLGRQGDDCITADDIASKIGTISYEVLCMIGNNNEREFR